MVMKSVEQEIKRIEAFIRDYVMEGEDVVVPVSGGIDSDLVARLCCKSLGKERVRLFIVMQSDMEDKFVTNARNLAADLDVPLAEIHLEKANEQLMNALESGESDKTIFETGQMLNPAKAKCSIRSAVISSYQDKGFLIAGATNRSEKELGFFLTFGDNLANFKPIAHLYKSQLRPLAEAMGTREEVIRQEPSAGFWKGQTDLEDLSYWILNDGPIVFPRDFTSEEVKEAAEIQKQLTQKKIDTVLQYYNKDNDTRHASEASGLPEEIVRNIFHIVKKSESLKNRKIMEEISPDLEGGSHALL